MKEITKIMYKKYALDKLKRDFMGYLIKEPEYISFHHLIIPHRLCRKEKIPNDGYVEWNGALLVQHTSHDYLHVVECYDYDMFSALTSEMVDENIKGRLDYQNLKAIDDILKQFEREHCGDRTNKGYPLIKEEYVRERLLQK